MGRLAKSPAIVFAALFASLCLFHLARWPIVMGDNDVWYHLSSGRYIWDNHAVPHTSFFSYLQPPREWVDYYWGFQALIYPLYSAFGYPGLIVLRSLIYLLTAGSIIWFLFRDQKKNPRAGLYFAALSALYCALLIHRYALARPHLFTYLFIVVFISVLEDYPDKAFILPPLAVLWANIHGITYPVMVLIIGAYLADFKRDKRTLISSLLALAAVFLTPHGYKLLRVPFIPLEFAGEIVQELRPLSLASLLSVKLTELSGFYQTLFNLLLAASFAAGALSLMRKPRLCRWLLLAGGFVLLWKAARFRYEYSLLVLPLLRENPLFDYEKGMARGARAWRLALAGAAVALSGIYVQAFFYNRPQYPFSHRSLPSGVAAFLDKINAGGRILNDTNTGGYLRFMLYPRYQLYMDMEVPFLFTQEDLFEASHYFYDRRYLKKVLAEQKPAFISVPIRYRWFKGMIRGLPDFVPVFFDDIEVLYVNRKLHPNVAKAYGLSPIDPFIFAQPGILMIPKGRKTGELPDYLARMLAIDPGCAITNQLASEISLFEGRPAKALAYADAIIRDFPEFTTGYWLKGLIFEALKRPAEAAAAYRLASRKSDPTKAVTLGRGSNP